MDLRSSDYLQVIAVTLSPHPLRILQLDDLNIRNESLHLRLAIISTYEL
jgi:hypothetical protein